MQHNERFELARQEGTEFRSVSLHVELDGSIKMLAHDMGPTVEKTWNDDDYEFWLTIPASNMTRLAQALLREKYAERLDAVDDLRRFCEANEIEHRFDSWA
ncbi:MAG: hypothetical protein AB7K64_01180 [Variibacter sp.]